MSATKTTPTQAKERTMTANTNSFLAYLNTSSKGIDALTAAGIDTSEVECFSMTDCYLRCDTPEALKRAKVALSLGQANIPCSWEVRRG
jgi:hypothetical protein